MPSARPTSVASLPPGMPRACTAKTGRIRNSPSMRNAKIDASETLDRSSSGVMCESSRCARERNRRAETSAASRRVSDAERAEGIGRRWTTGYISRLPFGRPPSRPRMEFIRIRGARTHNLKNVHLDLPRNRLVVITGLSGSGKSSLAFDTLYAEGQRRYVESLSAYARQFLQLMEKPDVDLIEGLSPAIAIEQKATSHNPRSTVGTVTEIHDYLRLLYARAGTPYCPNHPDQVLEAQTISQMVDHVLALPEGTRLMILAPIVSGRKGEQSDLFAELRAQGFIRVRVDGETFDL